MHMGPGEQRKYTCKLQNISFDKYVWKKVKNGEYKILKTGVKFKNLQRQNLYESKAKVSFF
jgi:hypothetical protein